MVLDETFVEACWEILRFPKVKSPSQGGIVLKQLVILSSQVLMCPPLDVHAQEDQLAFQLAILQPGSHLCAREIT